MIRNTDPKRDSKHLLRHVTAAKRFHQVECSAESGLNMVETRWWAKDSALTKVFGKFGDPEGRLYIDLVVTLKALSEKDNMKPTVRAKADGYAEALLK